MNAPKIATLAALTDQSLGWVAEQLGRAIGASSLAAIGRNRQLRATVALHCAQVKAHANKSMRSWKLLDTRLMNVSVAASSR
jgi:uncharacterized protein YjbJ (UPF0337 family)